MLSDGVWLAVNFSIHPKGAALGLGYLRDGSVLPHQTHRNHLFRNLSKPGFGPKTKLEIQSPGM